MSNGAGMVDLEYLLVFGLPGNKVELIEGKTPTRACFPTRDEAEAHFNLWTETLARWQRAVPSAVVKAGPTGRTWTVDVAGFEMTLDMCRIDLDLPMNCHVFKEVFHLAWRPEVWELQPRCPVSRLDWMRIHDAQTRAWWVLHEWEKPHGGTAGGRVDLLLGERTCVNPNGFYFRAGREDCLIRDAYFEGAPDLIVECMSPSSEQWNRGERMALYREAGIPEYWMVNADDLHVEVLHLEAGRYVSTGIYRPGQRFPCRAVPEEIDPERILFPWGRFQPEKWLEPSEDLKPIEPWIVPPEEAVGLQDLVVRGHFDRRFEYWNGRAIAVLPFGSEEEAAWRLERFVEDAARWEGIPVPTHPTDVGRFHFRREGQRVYGEIDVDGADHRRWLRYWHWEGKWDPEK